MRTIRGKRALVTGAAGGIGRAIALELAREGAELYLLDVNPNGLAEVVGQAKARGVAIESAACDVSQPHEIGAAVAAVLRHWGGLDMLVNNAGVAYYGRTEAMSTEQCQRLMAINLLAPMQFIRELLPTLLAQDDAHILNVCSILGLVPMRKLAAYNASKFALVGFSRSLRAEYAGHGLGVTAVCPGFVSTNIFHSAMQDDDDKPMRIPPSWMCTTPERVAAKAIRAIRRNRGIVPITPLAHVMWFLQRLTPGGVDFLARGRWRNKKKPMPRANAIQPPHDLPTSQPAANTPG
jgi:NAD(P)-dependent dehydrogenase (short-subunit alcohol dehydrogenase family)